MTVVRSLPSTTFSSSLRVQTDGPIVLLELNRPHARNALDPDLVAGLAAALEHVGGDPAVRAIVLTGAGGAFCAGADLKAVMGPDGALPADMPARIDVFHRVIRALTGASKPVLAAVDGPAVGFGCDVALACDLRFASPRAYFQEKFVALGLMPDGGGTFSLPRLVGVGKAMELFLTGDPLTAEEAATLGLVQRIVAPDQLVATTIAFAQQLAQGPPLAFAHIKQSVYAGLSEALDREKLGQIECLASADATEGVSAWLQKRTPTFHGR